MGYDRAAALDTTRLGFAEYPGLEVVARRPGFAGEQAVERAWPVLLDEKAGRHRQEQALTLLADAFAAAVVDWTLEWEGMPLPVTVEALCRLDTPFLLMLATTWVEQVALQPRATEPAELEPEDEGPDLSGIPVLALPDPPTAEDAEDVEPELEEATA